MITSGGVSVGDRDIVKIVSGRDGGRTGRWLQVAVRPGKPFAFSTFPPTVGSAFGLAGQPRLGPGFLRAVRPAALRLMAGHHSLERPRLPAVAASDMRRQPDGRLHLVRVT